MTVGTLMELWVLNRKGHPTEMARTEVIKVTQDVNSNSQAQKKLKKETKQADQPLPDTSRRSTWIACGIILIMAFAFWCFWFPVTYGLPLSTQGASRREIIGQYLFYIGDEKMYNCRKENR